MFDIRTKPTWSVFTCQNSSQTHKPAVHNIMDTCIGYLKSHNAQAPLGIFYNPKMIVKSTYTLVEHNIISRIILNTAYPNSN